MSGFSSRLLTSSRSGIPGRPRASQNSAHYLALFRLGLLPFPLKPHGARTLATHRMTLSEAVIADHQQITAYAEEYNLSKGNADAQERWGNQLTWEIARHAVGEEIVVYPLLQKYFGQKGADLADDDRAEHQNVKEKLYKLSGLEPGTFKYDEEIGKIMKALRAHIDREETDDLPLLEEALGEEQSRDAATSFERTKKFAPTRAHPMAPNKPPYETLVGFLAAPIDKLRDEFTKFPTEEMKEEAKEKAEIL